MSVRLLVIVSTLLGSTLAASPLLAAKPWTLKKQVLLSKVIVRGKVLSVSDKVVDVTRDYLVKAYQARVARAEVIKGKLDDAQFVVGYRRHIGKQTPFPEVTIRPGKEYVFYLLPGPDRRWVMISPYFGAVRNYYGLIADIRGALATLPRPAMARASRPAPRTAPRPERKPRVPARRRVEIPRPQPPKAVGGLLAITRVEKQQVAVGQPLKLWLVLKNVGERRLDLYFKTLDRFATFEIYRTSPEPAKLRAENPESPAPPIATAYVPLEKGSYVYTSVALSRFVKLTPGRYQVRVRVELPPIYGGKGLGKQGWTGVLHSGWAQFEVTGPAAKPRQSWRRPGTCEDTHLGALEHGTCGRCRSRSSSKSKKLCVFCADELGVCGFCLKKAGD